MIISSIKIFFIIIWTFIFSILTLLILPINYKGKLFHFLLEPWSWGILLLGGIRIKVKGKENLKPGQNYIFVSNHASNFDIPIVGAAIRKDFRFIAKTELTKIPLFGFVLKHGGYIIVDRKRSIQGMRSIEKAVEKIKNGISIILFAEGSRSMDGTIQQFKRGAFLLASKSGVPIIPVTLKGSHYVLPKKKLRIHSGSVEVILDKPLDTSQIMNKQDEISLMEKVREIIVKNYIN